MSDKISKITTVQVPLKEIQETKQLLMAANQLVLKCQMIKDKKYAYIPIKDKNKVKVMFKQFKIIDKKLKMISKETDLRKILAAELNEEEFAELKTAYDIIGTIAIIEIDEKLKHKEKYIAETLLKANKAIKTVLKKAGAHGGEFRTQKLEWLAGEKTKETIHKENRVSLKLNVEEVYFSPRLSTERKRIMNKINEGEDILVMFSGCAPYPCVLAKNTKARNVFGIELNPAGHKYGMKNIKLNKLHNVIVINGDVKKVVPYIFHYIVGMKSADKNDELETRLIHHPVIMELHLFDSDIFEGRPKLEKTIKKLQDKGVHVVLHMPFGYNGKRYSLGQMDIKRELAMFKILGELCRKYHIKAVVHPTQDIGIAEDEEMLVDNIRKLEKYYDYFYFENVTHGLFAKTGDIVRIGKKAGIRNMCIDTCHLFITYRDNDKIEKHIKKIRKNFNTYFHLNDHDYKTHSCEIGKGYIDFSKILPYVNLGVTEVCNKNEKHPKEMIRSYINVEHTLRKFDRILMPLPKTADDFLATALSVAKKGTIIHFYDFLNESEFDIAKVKIFKACKKAGMKYRILDIVKCGQHSPKVYRICVDFKIL
ncbi:MAG: hypothetical protein KAI26_07670 [Nanoarchaeota archaeon]|nr:hypothetical protein [Nanoarchaeota archaeon]